MHRNFHYERMQRSADTGTEVRSGMKSVPPRGSGWVEALPIANCQMPIGCLIKNQLAIGNRKSAIVRPTRYRVVVLTSSLHRERFPALGLVATIRGSPSVISFRK
jgi:hypothetical protein